MSTIVRIMLAIAGTSSVIAPALLTFPGMPIWFGVALLGLGLLGLFSLFAAILDL